MTRTIPYSFSYFLKCRYAVVHRFRLQPQVKATLWTSSTDVSLRLSRFLVASAGTLLRACLYVSSRAQNCESIVQENRYEQKCPEQMMQTILISTAVCDSFVAATKHSDCSSFFDKWNFFDNHELFTFFKFLFFLLFSFHILTTRRCFSR